MTHINWTSILPVQYDSNSSDWLLGLAQNKLLESCRAHSMQSLVAHASLCLVSVPVSLWLFGAHVGVRRLLGDKDTANLAQLLVHLKVKVCKMQFKTVRTEHQNIRTFRTSSISAAKQLGASKKKSHPED